MPQDRRRPEKIITLQTIPLQGGVNTAVQKTVLPSFSFSDIQNLRPRHPGEEQRKGCVKQHSNADGSLKTLTLHQFSKGKRSEKNVYRQAVDGSLIEATSMPPSITSGAFGSDVLSAIANPLPAVSSILKDYLLYSDGVRQHQIFGGSQQKVDRFIVYKGSETIPVIPEKGEDYSRQVSDDDSSTVAVLDDLDTLANFHTLFIGTPVVPSGFKFTVSAANGNASVMTINYYNGSFTAVSGFSDGTIISGASLGQTGTASYTLPTDCIANYMFGENLFWTQIIFSAQLDAEVEISAVTFDTGFQPIQNVWDGVLRDAIEVYVAKPNKIKELSNFLQSVFGGGECRGLGIANDDNLWITQWTAGIGGNVYNVNSSTGVQISTFAATTINGSAGKLHGITQAPDGNLWIVSRNDSKVWQTNTSGAAQSSFLFTAIDGSISAMRGLTMDSNGDLWCTDNGNSKIWKFNTSGSVISSFLTTGVDASATSPLGIGIDSEGNVWFYDNATKKLYKTTPTGTKISEIDMTTLDSGIGDAYGFEIKSDGSFWCTTESGLDKVFNFEITTIYTSYKTNAIIINSLDVGDYVYFNYNRRVDSFYIDVGSTTNSDNSTIDGLDIWTGSAWVAASNLNDGTNGILKNGFVTFDRNSSIQKQQFQKSQYYSYWYRFKVSAQLDSTVTIGIQVMPYFEIDDFGKLGRVNAVVNGRAFYTFSEFHDDIYVSKKNKPMVLNGADYGILTASGQGKSNAILAMKAIESSLLVLQEEKGATGGAATIFTGSTPATMTATHLSSNVGVLNSKCLAIVDGLQVQTGFFASTEREYRTVAFWISQYGIMMAVVGIDTVVNVGPMQSKTNSSIANYFNSNATEVIRKGYEAEHFIHFDSVNNILLMGLVSGSSATVPNIYPVFDLVDKVFCGFDNRGQELSCFLDIEADSGNISVLQIAGGSSDGFVYQTNTTDQDVAVDIASYYVIEVNGRGYRQQIEEIALTCKVQSSGNMVLSVAVNGNTSYKTIGTTFDMQAVTTNDAYRLHRIFDFLDITGHHLSIKVAKSGSGALPAYFESIGFDINRIDDRS